MIKKAPRVLIGGTGSGCGKTTAVCALLQILKNRGFAPRSFKCGPDYIDPMFHTEILGVDSMNLDLFFSSEKELKDLFGRFAGEVNVIEGVMGFFDGMTMDSDRASAYNVSKVLEAPVILVVNVRGMALSAAAVVKGYQSFRSPDTIKGVIFNRASASSYPGLKKNVENECGIPVLGYLPENREFSLESRYLGLITAKEVEGLSCKMEKLAEEAGRTLDVDAILEIMSAAPEIEYEISPPEKRGKVRIAVARDNAFCFYYKANLQLLEDMGAELTYFSPTFDKVLPPCDGLLLGGGYPELYAEQLSKNSSMKKSIKEAIESGLPVIAECGGFMYLCKSIENREMVGIFDTDCRSKKKLQRFGYAEFSANTSDKSSDSAGSENLLFGGGRAIKGHEFHYFDADDPGSCLKAVKPSGKEWNCGHVSETMYAGYPHLYLPSCPEAAAAFIDKCLERRKSHETHGN